MRRNFDLDKHARRQQREACLEVEQYQIPLTSTNLVSMAMAMRHYDRRFLKQTMHKLRAKYNETKWDGYAMVMLPPVDHMRYTIALTLHGITKEQSEVRSDITQWFGYKRKNQLKVWNDWIPSDDRHESEEQIYDGPATHIPGFFTVDEIADDERALEAYYKEISLA